MALRPQGRSRDGGHRVERSLRGVMLAIVVFLHASALISACGSQARDQRVREASAHYKLGISYLNEQMTQEAFVEFQKAVELNPDDRDTHYALGHIYFLQMRYGQAEEAFRAALKVDSEYSAAHNYLGKVYEQKGDLDKAMREYRKALANPIYSTPDIAHYNLGALMRKKGMLQEAISEFRQAVLVNPRHFAAHYALAQVHAEKGDYEQAIQSFGEVLRQLPESTGVRYELAWAYLKSGARDKAASEFTKIIEVTPDSDLGKRSTKHLAFLRSSSDKLKSGMTGDQVMKALGNPEGVIQKPIGGAGEEEWILNYYDLILRFEGGRLIGYQEIPRE